MALLLVPLAGCEPVTGLSDAPDAGTYDCASTTPADLSALYDAYFAEAQATGCSASGCHGTGVGGLQFRSASEMWAATVGHPSLTHPDQELIQPGDPAHSLLFQRLSPKALGRMPQGGPYLDDAALAKVAGWICAGAPRPSAAPDAGADGGELDGGDLDGGDLDAGMSGPTITGFAPTSGVVGTMVTLSGDGFLSDAAAVEVAFHGVAATVASVSPTSISTAVPAGATTGPLTVTVAGVAVTTSTDFQVIQPHPAPVLSAVTPETVVVGGPGLTLTVSGSSFVALSTVELDGIALTTQFQSSTALTAALTDALRAMAGSHTLTVTTPGPGGGTSQGLAFVVENAAPVVSALQPSSVAIGSADTSVIVSGTGFGADSHVLLNGAAAATTFVSATELHVLVPAAQLATAGTIAIAVSTPAPGGGLSAAATLTVRNPLPVLSQIAPASAAAWAGSVAVTLTGSAFVPGSQATLDGANLVTTYVNGGQLSVSLGANVTAVAGVHAIGVTNPAPGGGSSGSVSFTVNNPAPVIASLTPAFCVAGTAGLSLTIRGSQFVPGISVSFAGTALAATLLDAGTMSVVVPANLLTAVGPKAVTVTNAGPGGGTASSSFEVRNPGPTLSSLTPGAAVLGADVALTAHGAGFVATSTLAIDGFGLATGFVDAATLTATIPAANLSAGAHAVTVTTPSPGGGTSSSVTLTVQNPAPTVSSVSPSTLTAGSADTLVTVSGTGFLATSAVTLNGSPATTLTVSESELTVTVPGALLGTTGRLSLVVVNPAPGGGSSSAVSLAVVNPAPTITALSPASALAGSGSVALKVSGTGLVAGTVINLDGAPLSTTLSAGQATATLDAAVTSAAGSHTITVTNPTPGGGTSAGAPWTVNNPSPTVSSLNPGSVGSNGAPFSLTITGTGFVPGSVANLAGTAVTTTYVNTTTLSAAIPTLTTGSYAITVTNPAPGGGTSSGVFLVATTAPSASITGLSPSLAISDTAFTLTVTGSGFSCAGQLSAVVVNGTSYAAATCTTTQLTASLPALAAGSYPVLVQTQARTSNTVTLTVADPNPVPSLSSLSPATLAAGSTATTLTVDGASFVASSVVLFNGAARTTTYVSATRLTAALLAADLATSGSFPITVQNPAPAGGTSAALPLAVVTPNPVPTLSSATPDSVPAGSGATTVQLTGTGFVSGAVAAFNGSARTTTWVSATTLTVALTAADTQNAAANSLTVTNPAPGGGPSGGLTFDVVAPNPAPTLSALSPASAAAGSAGFTLTVSGASFVPGAVVSWAGSVRATTFLSAGQLAIDVAANDLLSAGEVNVTVSNPAPGGGLSNTVVFAITQPNPAPVLSAISPASLAAGSGATRLTLNGSGFVAASVVSFNGSARPTQFVSATALTADLSASDLQSAGSYPVVVTTPAPGGGTSGTITLSVVAVNPVPTLTALTPATAPVGSGAFTLSIAGTGFVLASSVSLNGVPATTSYTSSTQLSAEVPASAVASAGTVSVVVTSPAPGGGTSNTLSLAVVTTNPVPAISSVTPSSASAGSGATTVTLTGTGFLATSSATFNGSARTTTSVSATQLTVDLLASDLQTAGSYPLVVTNPAPGGGASNSFAFTVVAPNPVPQLSSLSPASVAVGSSSQLLTAVGSGFVNGSVLVFNGVNRTTMFVSATQLTTSLSSADLATAGTVPVTVVSPAPGGGTSGSVSFSVTNPAPTLSSLSPVTITVGSGAVSLSVNGSGLVASSTVHVDGGARTTHYVNSTLVTADLLASDTSATGTHTITLVNPSPGGGTSAGATLTVAAQPNPTPAISALSPCGTVAGAGAFTLTITGTHFVTGATATFNATAVTVTFVSATQVTAAIPAALIASAPTGNAANVIVSNPGPGGGASNAYVFGVAAHAATLASNVQTIFTASCATSGCHGGVNPAQGLNLTSGQSYGNLVGVPCTECASRLLVLTCGPGTLQSYLVAKLKGTNLCSGSQMPKGAPLSSSQQQTIVDWIAQGTP